MGKLIYSTITSLDGYTEDSTGSIDWSEPDEAVHKYINDLVRATGTHLYGRRMYETMAVWETDTSFTADSPVLQDFASIWQAADKIVYSTTLESAFTTRTRIERDFTPEAVRQIKATTEHDILMGGPTIAAVAFRAGLIDECHLFITPIVIGGGKHALPQNIRLELELLDEHRFSNGMVHLRYRIRA